MLSRHRAGGGFVALLLAIATPGIAASQSTHVEVGIFRSTSFGTGGPLSAVETTQFHSVEVDVSVPVLARGRWRLDASLGVIPLAWVRETALGPATVASTQDRWLVPTQDGRATSRGLGVRPLGLRGILGTGKVQLQAEAGAGVLRFGIPTPSSNATRLNFSGELGVGVRVELARSHVGFGYRLHHLSNAGRGDVNPGIDSHMLYAGFWIRR